MLSILIIPAASALPLTYDNVVSGVSAHGYSIQALHTPSVGLPTGPRPGKPPNMYDDAAFIARHITDLAEAGHDVLLVTHSYGGTPATESIKGLTKNERQKIGKSGGVVGLAYMTSLVPEVGKPASTGPWSPLMEIGDDGWFYYPNDTITAKVVFSDVPLEQGLIWAKELVTHSAASFTSLLTHPGYADVPVAYLVAEGDLSIKPATQRSQIEMIERVSGNKVHVTTTSAGHVPPLTAPDDVVKWILSVVSRL
ncbi:unnamed protein product [Clonostachys rosea]|uniref:AB hydrolase-1 domain-containing protein n=1 Tax=Bionectria ochroleuca TaxID=29856 RepID=A0ABY6TS10_BIOOC|nr:unnamed protein product [Clonostachys rosea]